MANERSSNQIGGLGSAILAGLIWIMASAPSSASNPNGPEGDPPAQTAKQPAAEALKAEALKKDRLFTSHVRPLFERVCLECHDSEKKTAGLDLSTQESLLHGGDRGPVVVPGNAQASLLYQLVAHKREPFMPYGQNKLSDELIAQIKAWIDAGVPYDRPLLSRLPNQKAGAAKLESDPKGVEYFEAKIRPVLVERCYECHSNQAPTIQGGLVLDSWSEILRGGRSGPAIVPGDPDKSLLIEAIRYTHTALRMPPDGKLPAQQIADFETWVKMGAPAPRTRTVLNEKPNLDLASARQFWAFQPPKEYPLPKVKFKQWPKTPIDRFVLSKLEEKGLRPAPPADKRTLIRRATFDLIGLPPKPEEVDAFLADSSPDAFAKVVDQLLASPHYGERWGRYWLDLARYADTKGYVFEEERRYPYAHTYRDWVIRAFNEDMPYDQFLIRQMAADRLPLNGDKPSLAAMGFLTVGRRFLNNIHDIIDDRIDVVTRTTMALTVSCARCHDHKYDPIPTKDYYSLYGVFANSREPKDPPIIALPEKEEDYVAFQKELARREKEVTNFLEARHTALITELRTPAQLAAYLLAAHDARHLPDDQLPALAQKRDLNPLVLQRWKNFLKKTSQDHDPIFAPWHALAPLNEQEFPTKSLTLVKQLATSSDSQKPSLVAQALAQKPPASMCELAERYAALLADVDKPTLSDREREALHQVLYGPEAPPNVPLTQAEQLFNRADRNKLRDLRKKVDQLKATHPGAPAHAMTLEDAPTLSNPHVFVRGNPNNLGDEVPRRFLTVLSNGSQQPFKQGSGRLELAHAIASKENPLTARVMVNRIWLHHFGAGLVRTPSDFGKRSEPPTHPELLDYLARRFMADGWSIKKLHRMIMLSSVYQQSSQNHPKGHLIDPENRLLWRMSRRRLDFEALRDALLAASGQLDSTMGGRSVNLAAQPFSRRRTVYGFIDRQNLPSMFRSFDFASPDTHSPQRHSTTVPQQALFMMNSPFVLEQARQLVRRPDVTAEKQAERRIQQLYRLVYQRAATPEEVKLGLRFLQATDVAASEPLQREPFVWHYGYGPYDESTQRVNDFHPLLYFTGEAWQESAQRPDSDTGAALSAVGGHPGHDPRHAVIRRWVAPRKGVIGISGTLSHKQKEGDGVRARIVSSRLGELASWTVHNRQAETKIEGVEVNEGDAIDFVVDCRANPDADAFTWAPMIRMQPSSAATATKDRLEWNAANEFGAYNGKGPERLTAWEQYAQVLLEANEFVFVD